MNLSDHPDPDEVPDPSAPWRYPRRPPFRPSLSFLCGLMLLLCLSGTWIAACSRRGPLVNREGAHWAVNYRFWIGSRGYNIEFTRAIPPPPWPKPVIMCGCVGPDLDLRHSLDWGRYEGWGYEVRGVRIDHWLLIAGGLALWGSATWWQARRKRTMLREARRAIREAVAG